MPVYSLRHVFHHHHHLLRTSVIVPLHVLELLLLLELVHDRLMRWVFLRNCSADQSMFALVSQLRVFSIHACAVKMAGSFHPSSCTWGGGAANIAVCLGVYRVVWRVCMCVNGCDVLLCVCTHNNTLSPTAPYVSKRPSRPLNLSFHCAGSLPLHADSRACFCHSQGMASFLLRVLIQPVAVCLPVLWGTWLPQNRCPNLHTSQLLRSF